ncbi:MAG: cation transporter [Clostridia bacterium]|nr:cation transporter [Clostridia bacterium]
MVSLLSKWFIQNRDDLSNPDVRQKYGVLCGILGIVLNLMLFCGKLLAGLLSGSIAITADAFNNLSDAGSSLITLVGFRLAGQKPDPQHPFGHGRFEYISGLLVSLLILLMGFELGKSSLEKILNPEAVTFHWLTVGILIASIGVKIYMGVYNRSVGKKIHSGAMMATMTDSLGDAVATAVVLLATVVGHFTGYNIDGYCGAAVAIMIFIAGFRSAKETISPLLGQPPEPEFVREIERIVMEHEEVAGIHDLIVNDYGPGRKIVSLHAEIPADANLWDAHDMIDNIEQEIAEQLGCIAVIHMDPIVTTNEEIVALRKAISEEVKEIHPNITIHDFRAVPGPTHTNVIFDAVLPYDSNMSEGEAKERIRALIAEKHESVRGVVQIDRSYT